MIGIDRPAERSNPSPGWSVRSPAGWIVVLSVAAGGYACGGSPGDRRAKGSPAPARTEAPASVAPLDVSGSLDQALQKIVDSADRDVTLVVCDELLHPTVTLRTTETKPVGVLVSMVVSQLGVSSAVEGDRWTVFCPGGAGPGKEFRRAAPPRAVTVPKAPEKTS
jgi:hypothetical protein